MVRVDDAQIINDYLDDLMLQGKSPRTVEDYQSSVRLYHKWLQKKKLLQLHGYIIKRLL